MNLLNEQAINEIADNLKKLIDGGSEDIKKAMERFDDLSQRLSDKNRAI